MKAKSTKPGLDVATALLEVEAKSASQIEVETAWKWASRAVACFFLFRETRLLSWLLRAEEYAHEATEHAATALDDGKTLAAITRALHKHRPSDVWSDDT